MMGPRSPELRKKKLRAKHDCRRSSNESVEVVLVWSVGCEVETEWSVLQDLDLLLSTSKLGLDIARLVERDLDKVLTRVDWDVGGVISTCQVQCTWLPEKSNSPRFVGCLESDMSE